MRRAATSIRISERPRAGVLALVFMLATVATPAVDAWLHGVDDGAAAPQHSGAGDCVVCRLAATPWAASAATATKIAEATSAEGARFAPVPAQLRGAPARLTPPTRAPPA